MNADWSAGLGAGFSQLSNIFGSMLQQRMQADWEDKAYQRRLEAANKAEMEKLKMLEEFKKTQIAGAAPIVATGPDGQPTYQMQDINPMKQPIGAPRAMQPHERTAFDITNTEQKLKNEKALMELRAKEAQIEKFSSGVKTDEARRKYYEARASGKIGGPKPKDLSSAVSKAEQNLLKLRADLPADLRDELDKEMMDAQGYQQDTEGGVQVVAMDQEDILHSYNRILSDFMRKWQSNPEFLALQKAKRDKAKD